MIDVTDLTYIQNGKPLLNGVSFRLYNGKRYGVSGEGAAELLGVLAGSLACSAGRVNLNGCDLFADPIRARRGGGYLPPDPDFGSELTVFEFLSMLATVRGVSENRRDREVNAAMEAAGLDTLGNRAAGSLSLPQKRRFGLAQAAVGGTERLLLADPAKGLEEEDAQELWETLDAIRGDRTVLIATDDETVLSRCDAVLRITDGQLTLTDGAAAQTATLSLTVRGERNAVFAALSRVETVRTCRPALPNGDGSLPLTVIAETEDPAELAAAVRAELEADGIELLSLEAFGGPDGKETAT